MKQSWRKFENTANHAPEKCVSLKSNSKSYSQTLFSNLDQKD